MVSSSIGRWLRMAAVAVGATVLLAVSASEAHAQSAWGGGCGSDAGMQACIGMVWPTLYADYYMQQSPPGTAYTETYICVGTTGGPTCTFKGYGVVQSYYGTFSQNVSGVGYGYTQVYLRDYDTNDVIAVRYSQTQYWDESADDDKSRSQREKR
jgi:hypothetical protein